MDEVFVVSTASALYDAAVFAFMAFWLCGIGVMIYVWQAKVKPESAFLRGMAITSLVSVVLFFSALWMNTYVFDPVMKVVLSEERVTFVYRSGAEVVMADVVSVRATRAVKSGGRWVTITAASGAQVSIQTGRNEEIAEAVGLRFGMVRSGRAGEWRAQGR